MTLKGPYPTTDPLHLHPVTPGSSVRSLLGDCPMTHGRRDSPESGVGRNQNRISKQKKVVYQKGSYVTLITDSS